MMPTTAPEDPTSGARMENADAPRARGSGSVFTFLLLSSLTVLGGAAVGILLILQQAAPQLGLPNPLAAFGIQPLPSEWSAWLGFLALQAAAFDAFLLAAIWRRDAWAHPLVVAKTMLLVLVALATVDAPSLDAALKILVAAGFLQYALSRRVRSQFKVTPP